MTCILLVHVTNLGSRESVSDTEKPGCHHAPLHTKELQKLSAERLTSFYTVYTWTAYIPVHTRIFIARGAHSGTKYKARAKKSLFWITVKFSTLLQIANRFCIWMSCINNTLSYYSFFVWGLLFIANTVLFHWVFFTLISRLHNLLKKYQPLKLWENYLKTVTV